MAVHEIATLHLGPHGAHDELHPDMLLRELRAALRDITHALKSVDDRITYVYVRPLESSGEDIVATRPAEAG